MICAIHQPNFLPWYPYFEKMQQADIFVHLTHCQFEKGGYQNRFNLDGRWYTMSVNRGLDPVSSKRYINHVKDFRKIIEKLPQYADILSGFNVSSTLVVTNMNIISTLHDRLNINTQMAIDYPTDKTRDDRLIELCKYYDCDTYLAGPSGRKYMDFNKWYKSGIKVKFFEATDKRHTLEVLCD